MQTILNFKLKTAISLDLHTFWFVLLTGVIIIKIINEKFMLFSILLPYAMYKSNNKFNLVLYRYRVLLAERKIL